MQLTVVVPSFGKMFGVPTDVVDQYLRIATPNQLKILLYVLRHCGEPLTDVQIADTLGLSAEMVSESMMFWQQTDIFRTPKITPDPTPVETPSPELPKDAPAPPLPVAEAKMGELTPTEIAAAIEASDDLRRLMQMVEKLFGRPLRHTEQKSLVWLHDFQNIGSDVIFMVLNYCQSIDKLSVSYAEKIIISWWDAGCRTMSDVDAAIRRLEKQHTYTDDVMHTLNMTHRPTTKQQAIIDTWQEQNISQDLIALAGDETIDHIDKLSFPYMDKILSNWLEAGCRTKDDALSLIAKKRPTADATPEDEDDYEDFFRNLPKKK